MPGGEGLGEIGRSFRDLLLVFGGNSPVNMETGLATLAELRLIVRIEITYVLAARM
jgi:hypothetical protein